MGFPQAFVSLNLLSKNCKIRQRPGLENRVEIMALGPQALRFKRMAFYGKAEPLKFNL